MSFAATAFALLATVTGSHQQVLTPDADGRVVIRQFDPEAIGRWASCAWAKMPVTSQHLVDNAFGKAARPDNREIPFASAEELLNVRLNKACGEFLPADHRNPIRPAVKRAKTRILGEERPQNIALKDAAVAAYLCAQSISGRYLVTEYELDMPRPKRRIPDAKVECFSIEPDGSLKDA
jgi:hypothetical protein